jgi:hypothetical protein
VISLLLCPAAAAAVAAQITVHTKEYNEDGEDIIKTGKLYLVDRQ